jgi:hypothetical protein
MVGNIKYIKRATDCSAAPNLKSSTLGTNLMGP